MAKYSWSYDQLTEAIKSSFSLAQVMKKIGIVPAGGNYSTLRRVVKEFKIDTTHFTGQLWNKGRKFPEQATDINEYLTNRIRVRSSYLRVRLIKEGYFERKCYGCFRKTWLGKAIPLELEHKDGDHDNNSLNNLTLLCPNCHAFTPTYRRKK